MNNRKLRMGMIGGGPGAFIGAIHRIAASMDGMVELTAGSFSSDPEKSRSMAGSLQIATDRAYGSYQEMIMKEKDLPEEKRIDFVSIVTPNHVHFEPSKMAMENGFHVVLDKPMTFDVKEAMALKDTVEKTGKLFCLTHTYTGYPMIKEARQLVKTGKLGKIRKFIVNYPQGWLSSFVEGTDSKQAAWRTDPGKSGKAGCMGDIGTHAFNLIEYISGLKTKSLCASLNTVVQGRKLDDDGAVFMKMENEASGVLIASQVFTGEENNLTIQIYGDKGGLEWKHADPNSLILKWPDAPMQVLRAGNSYLSTSALHNCRTPSGHPEGFIEAFANHYRNFALCLQAGINNLKMKPEWQDFPGVEDGLRGMVFIDTVLASQQSELKWTEFPM